MRCRLAAPVPRPSLPDGPLGPGDAGEAQGQQAGSVGGLRRGGLECRALPGLGLACRRRQRGRLGSPSGSHRQRHGLVRRAPPGAGRVAASRRRWAGGPVRAPGGGGGGLRAAARRQEACCAPHRRGPPAQRACGHQHAEGAPAEQRVPHGVGSPFLPRGGGHGREAAGGARVGRPGRGSSGGLSGRGQPADAQHRLAFLHRAFRGARQFAVRPGLHPPGAGPRSPHRDHAVGRGELVRSGVGEIHRQEGVLGAVGNLAGGGDGRFPDSARVLCRAPEARSAAAHFRGGRGARCKRLLGHWKHGPVPHPEGPRQLI
mmetsp:Transcript_27614/g.77187  ORF Transcript_27614/g.77187 Transcript_27614/m.77187 type:complete len:316 (+) Transcript_27614:1018-1965(+)